MRRICDVSIVLYSYTIQEISSKISTALKFEFFKKDPEISASIPKHQLRAAAGLDGNCMDTGEQVFSERELETMAFSGRDLG
jgi:hypothetical protein